MTQPTHEDAASPVDVISELIAQLGADVVTLPDAFGSRSFADWSGVPSALPRALIRPRSTAEVARAMAICQRHRQPVVTQGGLTGLAGGACLCGGEVALSLERMNTIESLDTVSGTMTVQTGTLLQTVQEAALAAGWFFPLDLGARGSCTIGGNLATNAGGNRVIRYGMMRDQVLAVEAVCADGAVIGELQPMIKNNSGYDIKNLLIGSEGTLAVMTRAVLRLRPRPRSVATAWCGLADYAAVTRLLTVAQAELPAGVSAFEVMWPGYYDFVLDRLPALRAPLVERHAFYVLLESTGGDAARHAEDFENVLARLLEDGTVADAAIASNERDALAFWAIRDAPGEYPKLIPGMVAFDISFSIAQIGEVAQRCEAALKTRWPDCVALVYGHLGDGNLHVVVHRPELSKETAREIETLVYDLTREYNGSVSAEHGIGLKKRDVLGHTRKPEHVRSMRAIKAALDPYNILNPHKLFNTD
ncbi:FAD-binding oxidoreductase [Paraburkholderia sp. D1E]|uniref:FAD-binding oxidoreductase n=1 Tax=Paraburkholderia sp. D1E TaxID=3461398 RepID=UPI0040458E44